MSKPCPHCAVEKGPAIKELRRDAFKEANSLMRDAGLPKSDDGPAYTFDDVMTLACFLIGLGEQEDDD